MANEDLTAVVGGDISALKSSLAEATRDLQGFANGTGSMLADIEKQFKGSFGGIGESLMSLKNTFMVTLGGGAIIGALAFLESETEKAVKEFKKIGDEADKMAVSTDFFQTLALEAQRSGVEWDKVRGAMEKFGEQMGKLKKDYGDLHDTLEKHDTALLQQIKSSKTVEDGINAVANAIHKLKDPVDQAHLAAEVFGKDYAQLGKVLNESAGGLQRAADQARAFGVVVDENVIRHAQEIKTGVASASTVIDLQFKQALLSIMPVMSDVSWGAMKLAGFIAEVRENIVSLLGATDSASISGLNRQLEKQKTVIDEDTAALKALSDKLDALKSAARNGGTLNFSEMFSNSNNQSIDVIRLKILETQNKLNLEQQDYNTLLAAKNKLEQESKERTQKESQHLFDDTADEKDKKNNHEQALHALEQLDKTYYTETHQTWLLIMQQTGEELRRFKEMLDQKKITEEQYEHARTTIQLMESERRKRLVDEEYKQVKEISAMIEKDLESAFSTWITKGKLNWHDLAREMMQDLAKLEFKLLVMQPLFGGKADGGSGFGSSSTAQEGLIPGLFSGSNLSKIFAGVFHEGGTVGADGPGRWVSPDAFVGAHRYHDGGIVNQFGPGEVPIIAHEDELVIPKGGRAGHSVAIHIDARGAQIGVEAKIRQELARAAPAIVKQALSAVETTRTKRPGYLSK